MSVPLGYWLVTRLQDGRVRPACSSASTPEKVAITSSSDSARRVASRSDTRPSQMIFAVKSVGINAGMSSVSLHHQPKFVAERARRGQMTKCAPAYEPQSYGKRKEQPAERKQHRSIRSHGIGRMHDLFVAADQLGFFGLVQNFEHRSRIS